MRLCQRIIVFMLIGFGSLSLFGCKENDKPKYSQPQQTYFADRGIIGNLDLPLGGKLSEAGVGVTLGDVDSDGDLDLIAASCKGIKYFEKTPEGYQDRGVIGELPHGLTIATGVDVALGDIDKDGDLDLIFASSTKIKYFEKTPEGYKDKGVIGKPKVTMGKLSEAGVGITLGDVDGDGDLDLIFASPQGIELFENIISLKNSV